MADLIQLLEFNRVELQKAAAKTAVLSRRRDGTLASDHEAEEEFRRLSRLIEASSSGISQALMAEPLSRVSSEAWNRYQDALMIDLRTIYDTLGSIETAVRQMEQISVSDLNTTKAAILKAINRLRVHSFLKEYPEYQDLKLIDFIKATNNSKRYPKATVDGDVRMLELAPRFRDVVSLAKTSHRTTKTSTTHHGGGTAGGFGPDFSSEKAIDPNPKTFWAEVISHSGPIQSLVQTSWGPFKSNGVVGEFLCEFGHAVRVNNLRLLPFSEFPYRIIDVSYQDGPTSDEWMTLPGFEIVEASDDWIEIDFPSVVLSKLKILIEQTNYVRATYNLPKRLVHNEAIWSQIQTNVYSKEVHEIDLTTSQEGTVKIQPEQLAYLSALGMVDARARRLSLGGESKDVYRDISQIIGADNSPTDAIAPLVSTEFTDPALLDPAKQAGENAQVTRYEYLYGIRQIELSLVTYEPIGYYEGPSLDIGGNLISVELETEERHVEFNDGIGPYRKTSVEYELEVAPGVRFPLLPINSLDGANHAVKDEYLFVKNGAATLRFEPSAGSLQVRGNGVRLPTSTVTLEGRTVTIQEPVYGTVYTASYHVAESSTVAQIDGAIDSTRLLAPEVFHDTDKDNAVHLKYYPYVVYEIVRDQNHWKQAEGEAVWDWYPEFFPVSHGTIELTNGDATVTLTKDDPDDPDFGDLIDDAQFEIKLFVKDTDEVLSVGSITSELGLELSTAYTGDSLSGSSFIVGRTLTHDGRVWGLNERRYEPIKVFVDGEKAHNITDYLNFKVPVFSGEATNNRIEFVHSGRSLFFNQPLKNKNIQVVYSWLCQYLKVRAVLRCNIPVNTTLTPKIDSIALRVKNTSL